MLRLVFIKSHINLKGWIMLNRWSSQQPDSYFQQKFQHPKKKCKHQVSTKAGRVSGDIEQSTREETQYAIFYGVFSKLCHILVSVKSIRKSWDCRCLMLLLPLEKGDFYLPNQWNHGKVACYLIYGMVNAFLGVWDNSNSMKAVCLQHDALPWEVMIMNYN